MKSVWNRIERWLLTNAEPVYSSLAPGVLETEIRAAELALGVPFPADYVASSLVHDGQLLDAFGTSPGFLYGRSFYPLHKALRRWRARNELLLSGRIDPPSVRVVGPVRADWWNVLWFPIADDGNSNYFCLDLEPPVDGQPGQIISVWNEGHLRSVLGYSFGTWLHQFANRLEQGAFIYSDKHNGLITRDEAIADGVL
jgi:cell wall assembly regulator SMI1